MRLAPAGRRRRAKRLCVLFSGVSRKLGRAFTDSLTPFVSALYSETLVVSRMSRLEAPARSS